MSDIRISLFEIRILNIKFVQIVKDVAVTQILNLTFMAPAQLHWESLDVDIELQALENPEIFPMIFI